MKYTTPYLASLLLLLAACTQNDAPYAMDNDTPVPLTIQSMGVLGGTPTAAETGNEYATGAQTRATDEKTYKEITDASAAVGIFRLKDATNGYEDGPVFSYFGRLNGRWVSPQNTGMNNKLITLTTAPAPICAFYPHPWSLTPLSVSSGPHEDFSWHNDVQPCRL
ncbi:MAG: hypothetical protein LUE99_15080 [Bacteroides sp.]|nr:hypothetical protein [Bacteroides sp.]